MGATFDRLGTGSGLTTINGLIRKSDWSSANDPFRLKYNNSKHHHSSISYHHYDQSAQSPLLLSSIFACFPESYQSRKNGPSDKSAMKEALKGDIDLIAVKNDSCENESNRSSVAANSSISNIVRIISDQSLLQTEENATSLPNLVYDVGVKEEVIATEPTKTSINDNFEDLQGRISLETLDLIRRLHTQYLNVENSKGQKPEGRSSDKGKSKKEEIINVSGRLEIL
uniref:Uncharacterized protein n=1 Tax=Elaeophora elaphi TaxID=1147741 RepID=A0A0R3S5Z7_9BILA